MGFAELVVAEPFREGTDMDIPAVDCSSRIAGCSKDVVVRGTAVVVGTEVAYFEKGWFVVAAVGFCSSFRIPGAVGSGEEDSPEEVVGIHSSRLMEVLVAVDNIGSSVGFEVADGTVDCFGCSTHSALVRAASGLDVGYFRG